MATIARLVTVLEHKSEGVEAVTRNLTVIERAVDKVEKRNDAMWNRFDQGLKSFATGAKTIGVGLTAAITAPILAVGAAAVKLGIDAVESENLVSVSFGNMKAKAEEWSKSLSANLGLNQFELRKTAGTIFNMTTSMGLARDQAFEMSTGVAKLAADMSSFRNIPMEEALLKIRSGLTGETEPLKAIGILVDEATIKQEAYRTGIAKVGAELTQQQKVMARWSAILRQTANDQGDLARTIDSPANQLRIMKTRLEEAATALGVQLMPYITKATTFLSELAPKVASAVDWFGKLPEPVKTTGLALAGVAALSGPTLYFVGTLAGAIANLIPLMKQLQAIQLTGGLASVLGMLSNPVTAAALLALAGSGGALYLFNKNMAELEARAANANQPVKDLSGNIRYTTDQFKAAAAALPPMTEGLTFLGKSMNAATAPADKLAQAQADLRAANAAYAADLQKHEPLMRTLLAIHEQTGIGLDKLATQYDISEDSLKRYQAAQKTAATAATEAAKANQEYAETQQRVYETTLETVAAFKRGIILTVPQMRNLMQGLTHDGLVPMAAGLSNAARAAETLAEKQQLIVARAAAVRNALITSTVPGAGMTSGQGFAQPTGDPSAMWQRVHGALEDVSTILTHVKGKFAEIASIAARTGQAIMDNLAEGDVWGAVVAGATGAIQMLSGLFGVSEQVKKARAEQDTFIESLRKMGITGQSSFEVLQKGAQRAALALGQTGEDARLLLDALMDTDHPERFKQAMEQVAGVLERLDQAVKKYNLTWKDLADPQARLAGLETEVTGLVDDFLLLQRAGYDTNAILKAMGPDFTASLRAANVAGVLDGVIDKLVTMGRISKETGDILKNMGKSVDYEELTKRAEKYGITLEQLGPKFQQAKISKTAHEILTDFNDLIGAGAEINGVMLGMRDEVNKLLQDSIKFGSAIPSAMKPMLETMLNAGLLVDANGKKLKDLSGITFEGTPLEQGIDNLTLAIKDLILALGGVPGAAAAAANKVPRNPFADWEVPDIELPDLPTSPYDPGFDPDEFHSGGLIERMHRGTARVLPFIKAHTGLAADEVPIIAQTGEAILSRKAVSSIGNDTIRALNNGAGIGGGDAALLATKFDRLAAAIEAFLRELLLNERTTIFVDGKQMDVRTEIIPQFFQALKSNDRHALTELKATLGIAA